MWWAGLAEDGGVIREFGDGSVGDALPFVGRVAGHGDEAVDGAVGFARRRVLAIEELESIDFEQIAVGATRNGCQRGFPEAGIGAGHVDATGTGDEVIAEEADDLRLGGVQAEGEGVVGGEFR